MVHTQPTSADVGDSAGIHTPADVGWKSGCSDRDIRVGMIEERSRKLPGVCIIGCGHSDILFSWFRSIQKNKNGLCKGI